LLVVIAIIAVLIALLLPAVQSAREAARRIQCVNNLKQCGIAFHNYASTHGGLPPSAFAVAGRANLEQCGGWCVQILGFMEQAQVYNSYNNDIGWYIPPNQTAVRTVISAYACPSSPRPPIATPGLGVYTGNVGTYTASLSAALGDYYTPRAYVEQWYGPDSDDHIGALDQKTFTPFSAISDGLSNTMLAYECAAKPDYYVRGKFVHGFPTPSSTYAVDKVLSIGPWASFQNMRIVSFTGGQYQYDGPCIVNCTNGWNGAYSFHPGGMNSLTCDGSVRFLKESISKRAMRAFVTRSEGEILSADQL
jgi:prepilin-type processing-associated H-X9-DG protein